MASPNGPTQKQTPQDTADLSVNGESNSAHTENRLKDDSNQVIDNNSVDNNTNLRRSGRTRKEPARLAVVIVGKDNYNYHNNYNCDANNWKWE